MDDEGKRSRRLRALVTLAALLAAFALGTWSAGLLGGYGGPTQLPHSFGKFREVVKLVEAAYVDEPNDSIMTEGAIEGLLRKLDPHSVYIPPKEQSKVQERFSGEFSGIGIQFEIRDDVLTVVSPIPGTPADRMGLRAGDKIVEINGESAIGITNDEVQEKLRGPEGSTVKITVRRNGMKEPFELILTRGKIPIHSVEASFMLDDGKTGYVMISQFTAVTSSELEAALKSLEGEGMEQLILDLRGNSGGYRGQAREVADKFIKGGRIITTTRGRAQGASDTLWATDAATHPYKPLVLLVNNGSASASEIVAGAIQDWDRGLIIGQPTFGKGLVQLPFELADGSVVRITISRWYTPAGRCVQRPYDHGVGEYYAEAFRDSLVVSKDDSLGKAYHTRTGRTVYGGHGILPDVLVDPGTLSDYGAALLQKRILFDWAQDLADSLGRMKMPFREFRTTWGLSRAQEKAFIAYAEKNGLKFDAKGWAHDRDYLLTQIKAEVAQRVYNGRSYLWQVLIDTDPMVEKALTHMQEADKLARTPSLRENG